MSKRRFLLGISATVLLAATVTATLAKPLRLAAPQILGLSCLERTCVEDAEDLQRAQDLVRAAVREVEVLTGQTVPPLTLVLCSTSECYKSFGGDRERAISFPWLGAVISGPDWQDYIIRHELIHWLQFDRYGAVETMSHPTWFREGMAYALSGAPDWDIPEHYQPMISRYRGWQEQRNLDGLWTTQPEF